MALVCKVFVGLLSFAFLDLWSVSSTSGEIDVPGFRYLGSVAGSYFGPGPDNDGKGLISYFISTHKRTQQEALGECRTVFTGRLLTIYTQEQNEHIRDRLSSLGLAQEQVLTAGKYNPDNAQWEWLTTTTPLYYEGWANGEPSSEAANDTVQLLGESSSYGWVSRVAINPHLFVCEMAG